MFFKGDDEPVFDLTQDTVTSDNLLEGVTAHDSSGEAITGTLTAVKDVVNSNNQSLVTDGVAHIPEYLENTASGNNSITIEGDSTKYEEAINIGNHSSAYTDCITIGYKATAERNGGIAIGKFSKTQEIYSIALGYSAVVDAEKSMQFGWGKCTENNTANFGDTEVPIDKITRFDRSVGRKVECICIDETVPTNSNDQGKKGLMAISNDGNYLYVYNGAEWRQIPLNTFLNA